jgi:hypothetical protein
MHPGSLVDCPGCQIQPGHPHQDWHVTRAQALEIGREMAQRAKGREHWAIAAMPDALLEAHVVDLKRQAAMVGEDGLPDFLADLVRESLEIAEKEWRWRNRAARLGAPALQRDTRWRERIETVRSSVDLAMLIAYECARARPVGPGKWECSCPFHHDPGPSLSIDVGRGLWHCFGCEAGGDAFTYVQLRYGLDFAAALQYLEDRLGIKPPLPLRRLIE